MDVLMSPEHTEALVQERSQRTGSADSPQKTGQACMDKTHALPSLAAAWNPKTLPRQHREMGEERGESKA